MKTEEILNLDLCVEGNKKRLSNIISKMKPVQKIFEREGKQEINIEFLERILHGLCIRYGYTNQGINTYYEYEKTEDKTINNKKFVFYHVSVLTPQRKWIGEVYGETLWEVEAKLIIKIFADIKAGGNKNE